jgi:hypothetical protein
MHGLAIRGRTTRDLTRVSWGVVGDLAEEARTKHRWPCPSRAATLLSLSLSLTAGWPDAGTRGAETKDGEGETTARDAASAQLTLVKRILLHPGRRGVLTARVAGQGERERDPCFDGRVGSRPAGAGNAPPEKVEKLGVPLVARVAVWRV